MSTIKPIDKGYFVIAFGIVGLFTPILSGLALSLGYTPYYEYLALRYLIRIVVSVLTPGIYLLWLGHSMYILIIGLFGNFAYSSFIGWTIWRGIYRDRKFIYIPIVTFFILATLGILYITF